MAKAEKYSCDGFPLHPRDVDKRTWFYEEKEGLCVVRQIRNPLGVLVQTDIHTIPWKFIIAAARTPAAAKRRAVKRKQKR